jgi:hypothetical protein
MRLSRVSECLSEYSWRAFGLAGFVVAVLMIVGVPGVGASGQTPVDARQGQPEAQAQPMQGVPDIFAKRIAAEQMAFLGGLSGTTTDDAMRNKQFRKLMKSFVPDCMFHYGRDMDLEDALEMVMKGSQTPVRIRDGRYVTMSGAQGPYLGGRGFVWIDMKDGIAVGAFYFHPTNGEPTPSLAVFSRQVKEKALGMSDLPEEFAADLNVWAAGSRVPSLTTRYFITGSNMRVLLEHDEDYCDAENAGLVPQGVQCEQMDADAADMDETAAYYLDKVHYRTNATAWMIGPDQVAWLDVRARACGVADLGCRIRVTREHTHVLTGRTGGRPGPHPGSRPGGHR